MFGELVRSNLTVISLGISVFRLQKSNRKWNSGKLGGFVQMNTSKISQSLEHIMRRQSRSFSNLLYLRAGIQPSGFGEE